MAWWTQTASSLHSRWSLPYWRKSEFLFFFLKILYHLICEVPITALPLRQLCYRLSSPPTRSLIFRHFTEFLRSHHFCKYQIEVLTSGSVFLADILFCESALFYFSEVSGPNFHLLSFCIETHSWHLLLPSCLRKHKHQDTAKMSKHTRSKERVFIRLSFCFLCLLPHSTWRKKKQ